MFTVRALCVKLYVMVCNHRLIRRILFALNELQSVINFSAGSAGKNCYAFNVAVGKKPTNASFYVDDASDVGDILVALSGDEKLFQRQLSSDESAASEDFFA